MNYNNIDILRYYINIIDNKDFLSNEELLEFLVKNYNFSTEANCDNYKSDTALLINNFLLVHSEIVNDLKEITERINYIEDNMIKFKSGTYEHRKLLYFKKINSEAKIEIEEFLLYKISGYVKERVVNKTYWSRSTTSWGIMIDILPYNYSYYKKYYDPLYDFSIESKFCFLMDFDRDAINEKYELKKNNPKSYYDDIDILIKTEEILDKIIMNIESHHRLKKRKEIFNTLYDLYKSELYQSFINLAVIQIEGIFYDLCVVINDENESDSMGTLSEKVEKVFKTNFILWLSIYPYFAFQVPIFRNRIAHNGIWNDDNLKDFANELVLDLNTIIKIIKLPYIPPNIVLILFLNIRKCITHLEFMEDDYENIFLELFSTVQLDRSSSYIFELIKEREIKRELLEHYIIPVSEGVFTNLFDECLRLSDVFSNDKFWNIVLKYAQKTETYNKGKPFDLIDFIILLTNNWISQIKDNTSAKDKCIQVKKELKRFI